MSRVDALIKSRGNLSVKFMEFTKVVSKDKYAVFFEGEDEKYYSIRINNIRPDIKWSGINCGGKSNVVELRQKVREHRTYSLAPCLFFIDADFDDNSSLLNLHDVYVTPCYSIENFYVSLEAYIRVLNSEFGVSETSEHSTCFKHAVKCFEQTMSAYINAIKEFNFLIRELRFMEKRGVLNGKLNINNIKIEDLVKIDLGFVDKVYDEKKPASIFPELPEELIVNLDNSKRFYERLGGGFWFRGKQNLEFFRVFIEKIKVDRCRKDSRKIFKNKGGVRLLLSKGNCISELSQYADTPLCLSRFLYKQNQKTWDSNPLERAVV